MKRSGIRARLSLSLIPAVTAITLILVVGFSMFNRNSTRQSEFHRIQSVSNTIANRISGRMNVPLGRVRLLADTWESAKWVGKTGLDSLFYPLLTNTLEDNQNYLAFWISLEMSKIDPDYAGTGARKTWLADRLTGGIRKAIEWHGIPGYPESPQYLDIKKTKKEDLIDPYDYTYLNTKGQRDTIKEATIAVPILVDKQVAGLAGMDFRLSEFDSIIRAETRDMPYKVYLIAGDNTIITGPTKDQVGQLVSKSEAFADLRTTVVDFGEQMSKDSAWHQLGTKDLYAFSPVLIGSSMNRWQVSVIVPEKEILKEANRAFLNFIMIGLIGIVIIGFVIFLISIPLIKPVTETTRVLDTLAQGRLDEVVALEAHDRHELGVMAGAVNHIRERFRAVAGFAIDIGKGKLDTVYPFNTESDVLGQALEQMQSDLISLNRDTARKDWFKTGVAGLNDVLRNSRDLDKLAKSVIKYISGYLDLPIGAFYYADDTTRVLRLGAGFAFSKPKGSGTTIPFGEGLTGQCAVDLEIARLSNIPEGYFPVKSSLGSLPPKEIMVLPCIYNKTLFAVIELGKLSEFTDDENELLSNFAETIAITVQTVKAKDDMGVLLAKTLEQKEELQVQEEELREANQTLEKQTVELKRSEASLQAQQEELRVTNQELEKNAQMLEEQSEKIAVKNKELEQATHEIEQKARDLEEASKYKSIFLANMSHELRTPLNSMLILSQSLASNSGGNLSPDEVEAARIIFKSGSDLHNLINEILDLSKIEAGKMAINLETVEVGTMAENISALYQAAASEKGLDWTVEVKPGCPVSLVTDQLRVEQIIKNLVSNAIKFTPSGSVQVVFDRAAEDLPFRNLGLKDGGSLSITVTDSGIGIPNEKQKIIFEAFQQADGSTSRKFGGTGLGLSISRELAHRLGGELHLSSLHGKGSTFTLVLPADLQNIRSEPQPQQQESGKKAPEPETVVEIPVTDAPAPPLAVGRSFIPDDRENLSDDTELILVIEDDPDFAGILLKECHKQHFNCIVAGDGESGYEFARHFKPAAIILDIKLPGIDGWRVLDLIKRDPSVRHIPIHMMSALDETIEAFQKGAIGYLKKPVNARSLDSAFKKIENFLDKKMKQLLIVEDNEVLRKTMHQLLKGADIHISEVSTATGCLDLLREKNFDCLILDLGLPDMDGFELIREIRGLKLKQTPPIIVYTGQELTKAQNDELKKYTKSIIIKGARSEERLLDEATLFLHRVVRDLPQQQQTILKKLYEKEDTFEGKTLLLADDDMRNIFALSKVFEEKGIRVLKAENGARALSQLRENPDVDAVLMDIMMPEMDGYEAMREIRKEPRFAELPIIAITAKAMKEDRQKCLDAGASDYISKPIEINKLLSLLRVWLKK